MSLFTRNQHQQTKGFTLLEVLLVVAIISILAGIVIVALNPNKNLGDTRNAQRQSDVNTILSATYQYYLDNGALPPAGGGTGITTSDTEICATTGAACSGLVDLGVLTTNGKYVVSVPTDPQCPTGCDADGTGYTIRRDVNNRMTVTAPNAESGKTISVSK